MKWYSAAFGLTCVYLCGLKYYVEYIDRTFDEEIGSAVKRSKSNPRPDDLVGKDI